MLVEIRKVFRIIGSGWRYGILIMLRSPINILLTMVNAMFLQHAFNAIAQKNSGQLTRVCILFGIAGLCVFLYNETVWSVYTAPLVTRMERALREKLFDKVLSLPFERIEAMPQGEWLTRLNTDVQMPFTEAMPHMAIATGNICVSAVLLWGVNPAVFGWVLIFVVPHLVFSQLFIARAMPALNKKSLESTASNTGDLNTLLTCADVALLYDGKEYLMRRFEKSSRDLFRANMKIHIRNALGAGILPLFGLSGYLTLLVVSSGWIAAGQLTFGDLTAAFQYRGGVLLGSLMLMNSIVSLNANLAGIRRLNETMAEK